MGHVTAFLAVVPSRKSLPNRTIRAQPVLHAYGGLCRVLFPLWRPLRLIRVRRLRSTTVVCLMMVCSLTVFMTVVSCRSLCVVLARRLRVLMLSPLIRRRVRRRLRIPSSLTFMVSIILRRPPFLWLNRPLILSRLRRVRSPLRLC